MATNSTLMHDEMKRHLTQLEEKIIQLTKIVARLMIYLMKVQVLVTPIVKLFSTSRDQNLS